RQLARTIWAVQRSPTARYVLDADERTLLTQAMLQPNSHTLFLTHTVRRCCDEMSVSKKGWAQTVMLV
ncbi:MAG: hypothetical protein WA885_17130, partial [Phormidesmis sp.]